MDKSCSTNTEAQEQLLAQKDEAERTRLAIDLENKKVADTSKYDYSLGIKLERLDAQKQKELEAAEATGADRDLIEKSTQNCEKTLKLQ